MDKQDLLTTRKESRLTGTLLNRKPAAGSGLVALLSLLIIALISQSYWSDIAGLAKYLPASQEAVFAQGEWWRLFTAILIHGDFGHMASNMYMLCILAFVTYGYYGHWLYPIITFIVSAGVNGISLLTYPPQTNLIGASGLVYVLAGTWLTLFTLVQIQHNLFNRLIRVLGVGLIILFPTTFEPTTSYRTHGIGLVAGIAVGLVYFSFNRSKIRSLNKFKTDHFIELSEDVPTQ